MRWRWLRPGLWRRREPLPLYVVGGKTAAAAARAGLVAQATAGDVAALVPSLPQGRALYLAGRDRKPDLEAALAGRIATVVVYEARARAGWDEAEAQAVAAAAVALHYSERSAELALTLRRGSRARSGLAQYAACLPVARGGGQGSPPSAPSACCSPASRRRRRCSMWWRARWPNMAGALDPRCGSAASPTLSRTPISAAIPSARSRRGSASSFRRWRSPG